MSQTHISNIGTRTKPVVLVVFERLVPGSQLVQRLEKLDFDVKTIRDASEMLAAAKELKPLLLMVDLYSSIVDICSCIRQIKSDPATKHLPIIAFSQDIKPDWEKEAASAGARFVLPGQALLMHLEGIIDQALEIE